MTTLTISTFLCGIILGMVIEAYRNRRKAKLAAFDEWTQTPIASKLAREMTMQYLIKLDQNV